jgi:hypothetical protein
VMPVPRRRAHIDLGQGIKMTNAWLLKFRARRVPCWIHLIVLAFTTTIEPCSMDWLGWICIWKMRLHGTVIYRPSWKGGALVNKKHDPTMHIHNTRIDNFTMYPRSCPEHACCDTSSLRSCRPRTDQALVLRPPGHTTPAAPVAHSQIEH